MLHQRISTPDFLFPTNPLRDFVAEHQQGLEHAARLLSGRRGSQCVVRIVEALSSGGPLTRSTRRDLNVLLEILHLEHVHDFDREEAGYFAEIDPAEPVVEEICLVADGLQDVMRRMNILGSGPICTAV